VPVNGAFGRRSVRRNRGLVAQYEEQTHMTSRDFCYWLQGMFELGKPVQLTVEQTELVRRHLNMVFIHEIDPSMGDEKKQAALNNAHMQTHSPYDAGQGGLNSLPHGTLMRC
jgi:hypothetical protein